MKIRTCLIFLVLAAVAAALAAPQASKTAPAHDPKMIDRAGLSEIA